MYATPYNKSFRFETNYGKILYSIFHNHEVEGVQAEAGFGEGFLEAKVRSEG